MSRLRILHLEDNPLDAELIGAHLAAGGLDCERERVDSREAFVAALRRGGAGLILADYSLPTFNGLEALELARAERPEVPFLFLTGALGEEKAVETLRRGAIDYVLKDRMERLVPSVQRALREAEQRAEKRAALEALRRSEEQFRVLAEAIPPVVWTAGPDGRPDFFNGRWFELTGLTAEQSLRADCWALVLHPDDVGPFRERWAAAVRTGQPYQIEHRVRDRRGGPYRWFLGRALPQRDGDGRVVRWFGTCTDIDDRKRAEAELAALARQRAALAELGQRALAGLAPEALMDEAAARLAEGLGVEFVKVLERLPGGAGLRLRAGVGWRPGLVGSAVVEDGPGSLAGYSLAVGQPVIVEDLRTDPRFRPPTLLRDHGVTSGMSVLIPGQDGPFGVLGAHTARERRFTDEDVHFLQASANLIATAVARGRAEEALRRSEERFRLMVQNSSDIITLFEPDGTIRYQSPAVERVLGYPARERIGQNVFHDPIAHPDDLPRKRALFDGLARRPGEPQATEMRLRHRDGTYRHVEMVAVDLRHEPSVGGIVANYRDVTERVRSEAELRRAVESAEAANRAKDQFLAILSHELRTPLTPALLTVSALLDGAADPEVRHDLELVRRNIDLEARLIGDLFDIASILRGQLRHDRRPVDAHAALARAVAACRRDLDEAHVAVTFEPSAGPARVSADPERLEQVFRHLIRNAAKFAPRGRLSIRTRAEAGRLAVELADDGVGIAPEVLPRIFDPFQQGEVTLSRRFGGLGLGLAISRSLIEAHGGRLLARSEGIGRGSTFTVELALAPADAGPPEPDPQPEPAAAPGPAPAAASPPGPGGDASRADLRVLLVEDDADTAQVLGTLLRRRGYLVTTAGNVATALSAALAGDFDLVISDIGLPDGTGLELMGRLRALRAVPGIALTGFGTVADVRQSLAAGFAAHLTKPVDYPQLLALIRRVAASPAATLPGG